MAADKIRANYQELDTITQAFHQEAESNKAALNALRKHIRTLEQGSWVGVAASAFYAEMNAIVLPSLSRLADSLTIAGKSTHTIATAIKQAEDDAARVLRGKNIEPVKENSSDAGTSTPSTAFAPGAAAAAFPTSTQQGTPAPQSGFLPNGPTPGETYLEQGHRAAGIDPAQWDPSKGIDGNIDTIRKVYDYYGELYRKHPELQWAGMARYTGMQTFYPAFLQVHALKLALSTSEGAARLFKYMPGLFPGGQLTEAALARLRQDVEFMEQKLLTMQRDIFRDMATQHEAYVSKGIEGIYELVRSGQLTDPKIVQAWEDIASGDPARISKGNATLLEREQRDILQKHYDELRNYAGTTGADGRVLSLMMSVMASSPMPNNVGHFWDTVPGGDISVFEDRWKWAGGPMLQEFQRMVAEDPARLQRDLDRPMDSIVQERVRAQLDEITGSPMWTVPRDVLMPGSGWLTEKALKRIWPWYVDRVKP
jgi:WXG100 family type VII secretion target